MLRAAFEGRPRSNNNNQRGTVVKSSACAQWGWKARHVRSFILWVNTGIHKEPRRGQGDSRPASRWLPLTNSEAPPANSTPALGEPSLSSSFLAWDRACLIFINELAAKELFSPAKDCGSYGRPNSVCVALVLMSESVGRNTPKWISDSYAKWFRNRLSGNTHLFLAFFSLISRW